MTNRLQQIKCKGDEQMKHGLRYWCAFQGKLKIGGNMYKNDETQGKDGCE